MRYDPGDYQGVPNQREFRAAATGRPPQWERSDRPAALAAYLNDPFGVCGPGGDSLNPLDWISEEKIDFLDSCRDLANDSPLFRRYFRWAARSHTP